MCAKDTPTQPLSGDARPTMVIIMTHIEEILQAVASLIKKKKIPFARMDIREELGLSPDRWMSAYTAIFQEMRIDRPGFSPNIRLKFRGVFKRVSYGLYVLTEYGEKLIKKYDC